MTKNWRWKLAIAIFSMIPAYGIGKYIEHWQIHHAETEVTVLDFEGEVCEGGERLQQFAVSGFEPEAVEIIKTKKHEYAVVASVEEVDSGGTLGSVVIVFKRRKSDAGSLQDAVSEGVVSGLVSSEQWISRDTLLELGFDLPTTTPTSTLYVNVDREYMSRTAKVTVAFVLIGLGVLFVVYTKLEDRYVDARNRRSHVNGQVALQMAIARQESYHR